MADDFDLWELIAAPIRALNDAEAASAAHFVELLQDYAFSQTARDQSAAPQDAEPQLELEEFQFRMNRPDGSGGIETRDVSLPFLQLMPIGGVSIDNVTLNYGFTMRAEGEGATSSSRTASRRSRRTPRFKGRLAKTSGAAPSSGVSLRDANISIEIKLKQMDLPQGILDLLEHTQGGRDEVSPPDDAVVDKPDDTYTDPGTGTIPYDNLFTATVSRVSGAILRPGSVFTAWIDLQPHAELDLPLSVELDGYPRRAFAVRNPREPLTITGPTEIEVELLTRDIAAQFRDKTAFGLAIEGTVIDHEGLRHSTRTMVEFPWVNRDRES